MFRNLFRKPSNPVLSPVVRPFAHLSNEECQRLTPIQREAIVAASLVAASFGVHVEVRPTEVW